MKNKATITKWLAAMLVVILLVTSVMPFETYAATINGAGSGVSGAAGGWVTACGQIILL